MKPFERDQSDIEAQRRKLADLRANYSRQSSGERVEQNDAAKVSPRPGIMPPNTMQNFHVR